jgi:hypothetical protein
MDITTFPIQNQIGGQAPEPIYQDLVDWQRLAEQAELKARRWQLTAELARLYQALDVLGEVES